VFHSGLFEVDKPLLLISQLLLDHTLPADYVAAQLFDILTLTADLLANQRGLVTQVDVVLLLRPLDDLIHGGEAFLHLLHEAAFALQALLLVAFQLVHEPHQLDLQLVLSVGNVFGAAADLLFNLAIDLVEDALLLDGYLLGAIGALLELAGLFFL
jgi:hypothetical protein